MIGNLTDSPVAHGRCRMKTELSFFCCTIQIKYYNFAAGFTPVVKIGITGKRLTIQRKCYDWLHIR